MVLDLVVIVLEICARIVAPAHVLPTLLDHTLEFLELPLSALVLAPVPLHLLVTNVVHL